MRIRLIAAALLAASVASHTAAEQPPQFSNAVRPFIKVDAPVVALVNARVIDGTGAPAREGQTLVIREGTIAQLGPSASTKVPEGATTLDLSGKSVMPGIVMTEYSSLEPAVQKPLAVAQTLEERRQPLSVSTR